MFDKVKDQVSEFLYKHGGPEAFEVPGDLWEAMLQVSGFKKYVEYVDAELKQHNKRSDSEEPKSQGYLKNVIRLGLWVQGAMMFLEVTAPSRKRGEYSGCFDRQYKINAFVATLIAQRSFSQLMGNEYVGPTTLKKAADLFNSQHPKEKPVSPRGLARSYERHEKQFDLSEKDRSDLTVQMFLDAFETANNPRKPKILCKKREGEEVPEWHGKITQWDVYATMENLMQQVASLEVDDKLRQARENIQRALQSDPTLKDVRVRTINYADGYYVQVLDANQNPTLLRVSSNGPYEVVFERDDEWYPMHISREMVDDSRDHDICKSVSASFAEWEQQLQSLAIRRLIALLILRMTEEPCSVPSH